MFRTITYLAAAAILTTGAVAAMADTGDEAFKVTVNKTGDYCIHTPAVTGSLIAKVECHTVENWAKNGVTFQRR
jgi:hypothetical protein